MTNEPLSPRMMRNIAIVEDVFRLPLEHLAALRQRAAFIGYRAKSERRARIVDRLLGDLWFLLAPLAEMLTFWLVVAVIFRSGDFFGVPAFVGITAGLAHYWIFQRIVSRCVTAIVDNSSIMLQVKIEPITFVAISFLNELFDAKYFLIILALAMIVYGIAPSSSALLYPLVLTFLIVASWSVAVLCATAYVFFRDLQEFLSIALRLLLYTCPIVYALPFVPTSFRDIFLLNPFATLFALIGHSLLGFDRPSLGHIVFCTLFFVVLFFGAHYYYERSKRRFTKVV